MMLTSISNQQSTIGKFTSGIDPVQHSRIRYRFPQVVDSANPGDDALDSHAETAVGDAAETPQIEVPLEGFLRKPMLLGPNRARILRERPARIKRKPRRSAQKQQRGQ